MQHLANALNATFGVTSFTVAPLARLTTDADAAYQRAVEAAQPFTPSRAQVEAQLQPLVRAMTEMPEPQRRAYVSGTRAGTTAALAVHMLQGSR